MLINPGASLLTLLYTSVLTVPVLAAANPISGAEGADTLANDPYPAHGVNGPPPNHGANRGGKSPFEHYTSNPSIPTAGAHYILPYHLSCQVLPTGPKKRFDQDEMKKATLHDAPTGNANEYRSMYRPSFLKKDPGADMSSMDEKREKCRLGSTCLARLHESGSTGCRTSHFSHRHYLDISIYRDWHCKSLFFLIDRTPELMNLGKRQM